MPVRLVVAITDSDWFEDLRAIPDLDEVNFWAPGTASFKALQTGELFLFKLHAPNNFIVGGGYFAYANPTPVPVSLV
jgi:putative restriction endonuclease